MNTIFTAPFAVFISANRRIGKIRSDICGD
jgi:hypothetical protein